MRFLVDAQLPPALARWIESQGYVAEHVHDFAGEGASDRSLWAYAATIGAVIISKDEDFVSLRSIEPEGVAVVWVRVGNTRKQALLKWFSPLFPTIVKALAQGEKLIEIR
jgi:predicted nuclease of predicted toxin-antitoxin system